MASTVVATQRLSEAIVGAARARVAWERARDAGAPNVWELATAHRKAEGEARDATERTIESYAEGFRREGK